jgi:hypothetical protein
MSFMGGDSTKPNSMSFAQSTGVTSRNFQSIVRVRPVTAMPRRKSASLNSETNNPAGL